ncbi:MAG: hypothetical protein WCS30_03350 [Selenomonadaceae bacterium]
MEKKDLEKTQYMKGTESPQETSRALSLDPMTAERKTGEVVSNSLEDTQLLPRVDEDAARQARHNENCVRELDPLTPGKQKKKMSPAKKRALYLGGGFFVALFCGFLIAGYQGDKQQLAENDRARQTQQMQQKEKDMQKQQDNLVAERSRLEKEKHELEEKQLEVQAKADRFAGKNEQMAKDDANVSGVTKLWNKVTGKEKERQQESAKSAADQQSAAIDADSIKASVNEAQSMLDEVDSKISNVDKMRQQVSKATTAAESAYAEHEDLIDKALYYAGQGVDLVKGLFTK